MTYFMDFKSVWPLLRKEGWTWKPATGIQIHHNYLKPESKIRGGKRGTDYFNGEDELLAYVRSDTELCARLNIANVWVRPPSQAIQSTIGVAAPDSPTPVPYPLAAIAPKRDALVSGKVPEKKRIRQTSTELKAAKHSSKKTKKMTKKQLDKEAADHRRELSSFGRVWGGENAQANDGLRADPPQTNQEPGSTSTDKNDNADNGGQANADTTENANADLVASSSAGSPASDDTNESPVAYTDGDVDLVIASSSDGANSVYTFDGSDGDAMESEDCTGNTTRNKGGVMIPPAEVSSSQLQRIEFSVIEATDPNLVLGEDEDFLDSDGEGSDDLVETAETLDDEASSETEDTNESVTEEVSRMIGLMKPAEIDDMRLRIQGSSEIYDSTQLATMAQNGWTVLPDDTTAPVTNDAGVDKMYDGYCGPSQGVIAAAQSPIDLFYYFLPKSFWRHVASESNRYWKQTLEARLEKTV
ncbi:hypothetical protein DVH05_017091 [Phytophthora capsici]|nr:hypothetical protein DVH05_017091 [Phytophthora capsici]